VTGSACAQLLAGTGGPGQELHLALGFEDESSEAAALQLWFASLVGADATGWSLYVDDAPRAGRTSGPIELDYAPIYRGGAVHKVAVYVRAARAAAAGGTGEAAPSNTAGAPASSATPEELEGFRTDARRLLAEAQAAIARLEGDLEARQALNRLFRAMHTLKGSAHGLGLVEIKTLAHAAEDELEDVRAQSGPVPAAAVMAASQHVEALRRLVETLPIGNVPVRVEQPDRHDPLAAFRKQLTACRAALRTDPGRSLPATLKELERTAENVPVRALLDATARALAARAPDAIGVELDRLQGELDRIAVLIEELAKCPLPSHLSDELVVAQRELSPSAAVPSGPGMEIPNAERVFAAVDALQYAGERFAVLTIARTAARARDAVTAAANGILYNVPADQAVAELLAEVAECLVLLPIVAEPRACDVLALLHDDARAILALMEPELNQWSANIRDYRALAVLYEAALRLYACTRRYRFAGLGDAARELLELLRAGLSSQRPQRSLAARIEQRLNEIDELLRLYTSFQVEIASSPGGPALVQRARRLLEVSGGLDDDELDALAEEAAQEGVLALRGAMAAAEPGRTRIRTLLRDEGAFLSAAPVAKGDEREHGAARLRTSLRQLRRAVSAAGELPMDLVAALDDMSEAVRQVAYVGLGDVLERVGRIADSLAPTLGKQVKFVAAGTEVRIPRELRAAVTDILTHAVRNSIDHGLETPDERTRAGKAAAGELRVELQPIGDWLRLEVCDDGRGVAIERVRARAVARGLITPAQAAELDEAAVVELLFTPGFSTAERVTDVSGRGVGMDAVRAAAEDLGGHVTLRSTSGRGTMLVVELPFETEAGAEA
jgi:chemotaxis protein histidine kinase CheA